ncbi:hypothetical protein Mjas_02295 [Methanothermococcus sp. Ax23]|uniref:hypothetical protein n=1 Tax=Methanothermococcus sp. Ax23 TaxID=3156486 RepID=UPI003BA04D04
MEIFKILLILVLIILYILNMVCGIEMYEYRDAVFYPDGSQSVELSRLKIIIDGPDIDQIYFEYGDKNGTVNTIHSKNIDINLYPNKFNISVYVEKEREKEGKWVIKYTIKNNYNYDIVFHVLFPGGYSLNESKILIPGNSEKTIELFKYSNLSDIYFGDSYISFTIPQKIKIKYYYALPIWASMIYRGGVSNNKNQNGISYNMNFSIKNNKKFPLHIYGNVWLGDIKNASYRKNVSIILLPEEEWHDEYNIHFKEKPDFYKLCSALNRNTSKVITIGNFHAKFVAWANDTTNISIKPCVNENQGYVIGIAKVKMPNNKLYRVILPENVDTVADVEELIKPKKYATLAFPDIVVGILIFTIILISKFNSRIIMDKDIIQNINLKMLNNGLYIPYNIGLRKIGGENITYVEPEYELFKEIHEVFDIPLNSAKAIAIGLQYGGGNIIILHDKKAYELAKIIGLNAIYLKEEGE